MRKYLPHGPGLNPSNWGKLLLTAGLLLVFVQGLSQLYAVQHFFFPGKYQTTKLHLISKEYGKINRGLTALRGQLTVLAAMPPARGKPGLAPSNRALSPSPPLSPGADARGAPDSSWLAELHTAKKQQVYVARKLNHIGRILQSMQQNLETRLATPGPGSAAQKPEMEKLLGQIRESRALWKTYDDTLHDLSTKLAKMAGGNINQQASTILQNKVK
jgi:hypothetical protein